jgi:hypothetical protein
LLKKYQAVKNTACKIEAGRMSQIYAGAYITFAADEGTSSQSTMLKKRPVKEFQLGLDTAAEAVSDHPYHRHSV